MDSFEAKKREIAEKNERLKREHGEFVKQAAKHKPWGCLVVLCFVGVVSGTAATRLVYELIV